MIRRFLLAALLLAALSGLAAATSGPLNGLLALRRAERLRAEGAFTAAEDAYRAALRQLPHTAQPALQLAKLYHVWDRPERGLALLDEAMQRGAASTETQALRLDLLEQAGEWEMLVTAAQARLASAPDDVDALAALTQGYLHLYRCADARETTRDWRAAAPEDPESHRVWQALTAETDAATVGEEALKAGSPALAACVLERATALAPKDAAVHARLGRALSMLGQRQAAQQHLDRATELAPEHPLGWLLLGLHALRQGEPTTARRALFRAHELDPSNPAPCLTMAATFAAEGHYAKAESWLKAALVRAPDDPEVHKSVAHFYLERNLSGHALAIESAHTAVELAPDDPEAHTLLGKLLLANGDPAQALNELERALARAPHSAEAHHLRGRALTALDQVEAAQDAFTRALNLGYRRSAP